MLLKYRQYHIHALRTKRHNKAVWALRRLLVSFKQFKCYILMNAGIFNNNPPENTVPPWLLTCTCRNQRCHCNARFKSNLICIRGLPYQANPPVGQNNNLTIQLIEFTYCNDRFSSETITAKIEKFQPLIENITNIGWNIEPLIIVTAGARAISHIPSMKILETKFKIPEQRVRNTFKEINIIAIHYAMSIILHKRRIENNELIPIEINPP